MAADRVHTYLQDSCAEVVTKIACITTKFLCLHHFLSPDFKFTQSQPNASRVSNEKSRSRICLLAASAANLNLNPLHGTTMRTAQPVRTVVRRSHPGAALHRPFERELN